MTCDSLLCFFLVYQRDLLQQSSCENGPFSSSPLNNHNSNNGLRLQNNNADHWDTIARFDYYYYYRKLQLVCVLLPLSCATEIDLHLISSVVQLRCLFILPTRRENTKLPTFLPCLYPRLCGLNYSLMLPIDSPSGALLNSHISPQRGVVAPMLAGQDFVRFHGTGMNPWHRIQLNLDSYPLWHLSFGELYWKGC